LDELIVTEEAWPYGLRCLECSARMEKGQAYSKRLVGITSGGDDSDCGYPIVEIVCVPCGLGLTYGR
jgi:hypothetical protein